MEEDSDSEVLSDWLDSDCEEEDEDDLISDIARLVSRVVMRLLLDTPSIIREPRFAVSWRIAMRGLVVLIVISISPPPPAMVWETWPGIVFQPLPRTSLGPTTEKTLSSGRDADFALPCCAMVSPPA